MRPLAGASLVRHPPRTLAIRFASLIRWLHIYVSLLGFTALMFFAVTGITLNHPTWFGGTVQTASELKGQLRNEWVAVPASASGSSDAESGTERSQSVDPADARDADPAHGVAKFEVVEHLRTAHGLRGAVSDFRIDEIECMVLFKGPGYSADVFIDRASGAYTVTQTAMGLVAIMNDLHKGRDSGQVWSWVIDVTALLMVFTSVTGLMLLFYLRLKRFSGAVTAIVGTIVFVIIGMFWVP